MRCTPRAAEATSILLAAPAACERSGLAKCGERILLVADGPAIATIGLRMLEQLRYTVTAKTSPKEALKLFWPQPDHFNLIITDYSMPQMVQTRLADECMRIRTAIPVIIFTGYNERLNRKEADGRGVKAIAMKPPNRRPLAIRVREVLDKAKD